MASASAERAAPSEDLAVRLKFTSVASPKQVMVSVIREKSAGKRCKGATDVDDCDRQQAVCKTLAFLVRRPAAHELRQSRSAQFIEIVILMERQN